MVQYRLGSRGGLRRGNCTAGGEVVQRCGEFSLDLDRRLHFVQFSSSSSRSACLRSLAISLSRGPAGLRPAVSESPFIAPA